MAGKSRKRVVLLLLSALLFAQAAVAAYACPALAQAAGQAAGMATAMTAAMPADCHHMAQSNPMDTVTPNLCVAHCQEDPQRSDAPPAPTVPPAMLAVLYVDRPDRTIDAADGCAPAARPLAVAASPPHTILHCCFRI